VGATVGIATLFASMCWHGLDLLRTGAYADTCEIGHVQCSPFAHIHLFILKIKLQTKKLTSYFLFVGEGTLKHLHVFLIDQYVIHG
jgi:hypothetical protein